MNGAPIFLSIVLSNELVVIYFFLALLPGLIFSPNHCAVDGEISNNLQMPLSPKMVMRMKKGALYVEQAVEKIQKNF
jgi:hypothetical protein